MIYGLLLFILGSCADISDIELSSRSTVILQLNNTKYSQYSLNVSLGTPTQLLQLALGLQTSWTWVLASDCNCSYAFSSRNSETCKTSNSEVILNYTKGAVMSQKVKDDIKLDEKMITGFSFLVTNESYQLDGLASSGVLGLGFNLPGQDFPGVLELLYQQKIIKEKIFSIYLSPKKQESKSFVTLGSYSVSHTADREKVSIKVDNSEGYWKVKADYIGYEKYYYYSQPDVFIDVGTSYIYGHKIVISSIKKYLKKNYKCFTRKELFCQLSELQINSLPPLIIGLSGKPFEIPPENYLNCLNMTCQVLLVPSEKGEWVLGIPFLLNYYALFDAESKEISLFIPVESYRSSLIGLSIPIFYAVFYFSTRKREENSYERLR